MPSDNSCNRWIFREGKSSLPGATGRDRLASQLAKLRHPTRDLLIDALIRAGELETALADTDSPHARIAAEITQSIANAVVGCPTEKLEALSAIAQQMRVPETIQMSIPEGFVYYALHPLAYTKMADSIRTLAKDARVGHPAAVIGIRSIGSTLGAVVAAALARNHIRADRITVRPAGHPFDRIMQFTSAQLRWIAEARHQRAEFLVVDEGPGLSGSSFLSVGEALLGAGVERRRIHFLCSHPVNPDALLAPQAAERWRGFHSYWTNPHHPPGDGLIDLSAGRWREEFPFSETVPSWTNMERMKFLSPDRRRLLKFAGFGRFGDEVGRRADLLASEGFGPTCFGVHDGYAEYEVVSGRPMCRQDLSRDVIERIARYCAMRTSEFAIAQPEPSPLRAMTRYNYEQEFSETAPPWPHLDAPRRPVLCDGRVQPHEWVMKADGTMVKTDGEAHGDDHFLPGPADIAWDLAGAIVEWHMDCAGEEGLLARYAKLSGDDASGRIPDYIAAYSVFRASYCTMAAHAMRSTPEEERLLKAAQEYRTLLQDRVATAEAA